MRIRRVELADWCCIKDLKLPELHTGVVILSGPNRTGKSSIVQALRSCLFDHDHTANDSIMKGVVPRQSKAVPRVLVEFDIGPARYRIEKIFTKNKEGGAKLEQWTGGQWTTLQRGKDANSRTRELIGVEKSQSGLFQLLWLRQGDVRLPDKIDGQLAKAVETMLGTMITGADLDFKAKLDMACERWFTKKMQATRSSPLGIRERELEQAQEVLTNIVKQMAEMEDALKQFDDAKLKHPELEKQERDALAELNQVQTAWDKIKQRQSQHQLAVQKRDFANTALKEATKRLQEYQETQRKLEQQRGRLADFTAQRAVLQDRCSEATAAVATALQAVAEAEAAVQAHQKGQAEIEDRQQLLNLATQLQSLDHTIDRVEELQKEAHDLEKHLAGPPALPEAQLKKLQQNRQEATKLRAELAAGELRLTFQAEQSLSLSVRVDERPASTTNLQGASEESWLVRQQAAIHLAGIGVLKITRGAADRNLDEIARRLDQLDREYADALAAAQLDPADSAALDVLTTRRVQHAGWTQQLNRVRGNIQQDAPHGLAAVQAQRGILVQSRQVVLNRRTEWEKWTPNQPDIDSWKTAYDQHAQQLAAELKGVKTAHADDARKQKLADEALGELGRQIAELSGTIGSLTSQLEHTSDEKLTQQALDAKIQVTSAEAEVAATALTDEERTIETRYQAAQGAYRQRADRRDQNQQLLATLTGRLSGSEGLHQRRIDAEQTVNDLHQHLQRETLHADAHRHLKELFEQVRQEHVQRTVGPVSERVLKWTRHLGLNEYAELNFGESFFPSGLVLKNASVDDEAIAFDRESYGTLEQLSLLVRLAVGGLLAKDEPAVAILDDPLVHSDPGKHRGMLDILARAARGDDVQPGGTAGALQVLIFTCHPERFDYLPDVQHIDLTKLIQTHG